MKMIKIGNEYHHILHEFNLEMFGEKKEYIINRNGEILYYTPHSLWGNRVFWDLGEITRKINDLENTKFRNQDLKKSRILHWKQALQNITDYTRTEKIEKIISEPTVWKFA